MERLLYGLAIFACVFAVGCTNGALNTATIFNASSSNNTNGLKLEVPIELLEANIASQTANVIFDRTRTTMNTNDYDGSLTYSFEISAVNSSASFDYNVELVDGSGAVKATLTVPASTGAPLRLSTPFTPSVGFDNYRVKLQATAAGYQVLVTSARILVKQVGATKTAIYVPLFSGRYDYTSGNVFNDVGLQFSLSSVYSQPSSFLYWSLWKKDPSVFGGFDPARATFAFEAVGYNCGGCTGKIGLFNKDTGLLVSEVNIFNSPSPIMLQDSFDTNRANFDDYNDFEVRIAGDAINYTHINKAGLWIKLSEVTKGEVYYKIAQSMNTVSNWSGNRAAYDASAFSNPATYFEMTGSTGTGSSYALFDFGIANDSTSAGALIPPAIASPNSKVLIRSTDLALPSSRYGMSYVTGGNNFVSGNLVVGFSK